MTAEAGALLFFHLCLLVLFCSAASPDLLLLQLLLLLLLLMLLHLLQLLLLLQHLLKVLLPQLGSEICCSLKLWSKPLRLQQLLLLLHLRLSGMHKQKQFRATRNSSFI